MNNDAAAAVVEQKSSGLDVPLRSVVVNTCDPSGTACFGRHTEPAMAKWTSSPRMEAVWFSWKSKRGIAMRTRRTL